MKLAQIPKKRGGYRCIAMPTDQEKNRIYSILPSLNEAVDKLCDDSVVHGFKRGRSIVTNAQAHVGFYHSLSFDLENFFNSITMSHIENVSAIRSALMESIYNLTEYLDIKDTPCIQGLPHSPALANLAAIPVDRAIQRAIKKSKLDIVYTRYADDLTFSFNDIEAKDFLLKKVQEIVSRSKLKLAKGKTHWMPGDRGRRIICGVAVDKDGIYPTRTVRRKLRAAHHQNSNSRSAKGLKEFSKLKSPNREKYDDFLNKDRHRQSEIYQEMRKYADGGIRKTLPIKASKIGQMQNVLIDNLLITRDVAYMVGISTITTNWRSCMNLTSGCFRRRAVCWATNPYTAVACLLSDEWMTIGNVKRRKMEARCILALTEDGDFHALNWYGEDWDAKAELKEKLKQVVPLRAKGLDRVQLEGTFADVPYIDANGRSRKIGPNRWTVTV